jgi:hypothetical protein
MERAMAKRRIITAKRLYEVLRYDPVTGKFFWRVAGGRRRCIGEEAGWSSYRDYWCIGVDGSQYRRNILAWIYMTGKYPTGVVDHINRQPGDDRWKNLRDVTQRKNRQNNGAKGYTKEGKGYKVKFSIHVGTFKTQRKARAAYLELREKIGELLHAFEIRNGVGESPK